MSFLQRLFKNRAHPETCLSPVVIDYPAEEDAPPLRVPIRQEAPFDQRQQAIYDIYSILNSVSDELTGKGLVVEMDVEMLHGDLMRATMITSSPDPRWRTEHSEEIDLNNIQDEVEMFYVINLIEIRDRYAAVLGPDQ